MHAQDHHNAMPSLFVSQGRKREEGRKDSSDSWDFGSIGDSIRSPVSHAKQSSVFPLRPPSCHEFLSPTWKRWNILKCAAREWGWSRWLFLSPIARLPPGRNEDLSDFNGVGNVCMVAAAASGCGKSAAAKSVLMMAAGGGSVA